MQVDRWRGLVETPPNWNVSRGDLPRYTNRVSWNDEIFNSPEEINQVFEGFKGASVEAIEINNAWFSNSFPVFFWVCSRNRHKLIAMTVTNSVFGTGQTQGMDTAVVIQLMDGRLLKNGIFFDSNINYLNISGNNIGVAGATILKVAFFGNQTLQTLICSSNKLGDAGVEILSMLLPSLTKLKDVYLGDNNIQSCGAEYIARALERHGSVESLNLCWNSIGDTGAKHLSNLLKSNAVITSVRVDQNNIGVDGMRLLRKALQENTTVTRFTACFNDVNPDDRGKIACALKENRGELSIQYLLWRYVQNKLLRYVTNN